MLRINGYLSIMSIAVLLLAACLPVVVPVPVIVPSTLPTESTTEPATLPAPATAPLFTLVIALDEPHDIGSGQLGIRYVSYFTGGSVTGRPVAGNQLQAQVLLDGESWYLVRNDQIAELNIQGTLQTDDGVQIAFRSRAFARARIVTLEELYKAALIDPTGNCFRGVTFFTTAAPQYAWLTQLETISIYHYDLEQVQIEIYPLSEG